MTDSKKIFEDFSRMTNGAFETMGAMRQEFENIFRPYIEDMLRKLNLVTREEYDVLQKKLDLLSARVNELENVGQKKATQKTTSKKTAPKK